MNEIVNPAPSESRRRQLEAAIRDSPGEATLNGLRIGGGRHPNSMQARLCREVVDERSHDSWPTLAEAARVLNLSARTVKRMIAQRKLIDGRLLNWK